jgi:hypothetical protein
MATSISGSQRVLLDSGFLDDLGSTETPFNASENALIELAAMIIENAQRNLQQNSQVSTGALSDSFVAKDPREVNNVIYVDISALDYYDYQNKGVKGTKGGSSKNNYSFKNDHPSEGMVTAIEAWVRRAGLTTTNVDAGRTITGREKKDSAISERDNAYQVARAIKQKGIKGTGYFDRALQVAQAYAQDVLGKALAVDVQNSLA